jgi:argininosuccinate lyase
MMEFGASIDVDIELLDADIEGSVAWAEALGKAGILDDGEVSRISSGLEQVRKDIRRELETGTIVFDHSLEDVHMTVEARLTTLIGDTGAKLHTGRSRNDQVALDERLYLMGALDTVCGLLRDLQKVVVVRAKQHTGDIVPAYTHLQQAQPVRLGHYLLAWFWMLERDRERFADARKRVDCLPLGSGAVAGCGFPVDREYIAARLGFSRISENSIDATADRDYIVEILAAAAALMMHLSRMSEDFIVWSSAEFGFMTLSDRYSTGSSMMPQKKNPDSLELVRGKTGRVYGDLLTILTVMKGLPLSYGKDMQEDKEPLFDALRTIGGCLRIAAGVIGEATFNVDRMRAAVDDAVFATDVADYLTAKELPFRKAHEIAGKIVRWAQAHHVGLGSVPLAIYREHSELFGDDVADLFDLERSVDRRSLPGGTGEKALEEQLAHAHAILEGGGR